MFRVTTSIACWSGSPSEASRTGATEAAALELMFSAVTDTLSAPRVRSDMKTDAMTWRSRSGDIPERWPRRRLRAGGW